MFFKFCIPANKSGRIKESLDEAKYLVGTPILALDVEK